jgi:integrating conjugative element protein (TIGR03761 family)
MQTQKNIKKKNQNRLKTIAQLTLHSRNAQYAFLGRLNDSQSLVHFDRDVLRIRQASSQNDPYADWVLLHIYNAMVKIERNFQSLENKYRKRLQSEEGVIFSPAKTSGPITYTLIVNTRAGRMAARIIASYDRIMQSLLVGDALNHDPDVSQEILFDETRSQLKNLFIKPKLWIKTNVTREDIEKNTPLAQSASEVFKHLGKLPVDVLNRTRTIPDPPRLKDFKKLKSLIVK